MDILSGVPLGTITTMARLARIQLSHGEMQSLEKDLETVFQWMKTITTLTLPQQIDGVTPVEIDNPCLEVEVPHEDSQELSRKAIPSQETILANAPGAARGFFVVPKVLEEQ